MKFDYNAIQTIATSIGTLFAGVIICFIVTKQKVSQYLETLAGSRVSSKVRGQSKVDLEILERMERIKELFNADRILVYEFHNGEHYANGRSALKLSCTYEVYKAGVKPIQSTRLGIPISCIPHHIAKVLDDTLTCVKDIESIREFMPSTYNLMTNNEAEAYTDMTLKNLDDEPVGFIEVQWKDKDKFTKDDKELYRLAAYIEEKIINK